MTGEPHYVTFDRLRYDYQGICKLNAASTCGDLGGLPTFEVYTRNEFRNGNNLVSYIMYMEIVYNNITVRLTRSPDLTAPYPNVDVTVS